MWKSKVSAIIQWASIVVGITGMSLDRLIPVGRIASLSLTGAAFTAFAVLVIVQLIHSDPNLFTGKKKVDLAWHALLTRASSSVDVFAGDVSWAQDNKKHMSWRTSAGVRIRVLCRWPSTPLLLSQVRALFEAGAAVKFYSGNQVKIRGLVVDAQASNSIALTVSKRPNKRITIDKGQPGSDSLFDYEARRHLPDQDASYVDTLHQLFESLWASLAPGALLDEVSLDGRQIRRILARVPHYRHLSAADIEIRRVYISSLYSCCRSVKAVKLGEVSPLLELYQRFALEPFEPCRVTGSGYTTMILPPIVEEQADRRFVVIDGMHRIYQLVTQTDAQEVQCLVVSNAGPLPSDPIPFDRVQLSPTKRSRIDNFPNYRHEFFRDVKAFNRYLRAAAESIGTGQTKSAETVH